jgi:hypothetical protein
MSMTCLPSRPIPFPASGIATDLVGNADLIDDGMRKLITLFVIS